MPEYSEPVQDAMQQLKTLQQSTPAGQALVSSGSMPAFVDLDFLKLVLQRVPIGMGIVQKRILLWVNDAFCEMLGYEASEVIGRNSTMLYENKAEFERIGRVKYAQIRTLGIGSLETRMCRKNGETIDVRLVSQALSNNQDPPVTIFTVTDITESRRAGAMLADRSLQLETLAKNSPDQVYRVDREMRYMYVNPRVAEATGLQEGLFIGRTAKELGLQPDLCEQRHQLFQQAFDTRQPQQMEYQYTGPLGQRDYHMRVVPEFSLDGQVHTLLILTQDITDRKHFEADLQDANRRTTNILNSISDGFFALNDDFEVTFYNIAAEQLLGRPRDQVIGRHLLDAFPEAQGSIFEERYRRALAEREPDAFEVYFGVEPFQNWYQVRVYPFEEGISIYFQVTTKWRQAQEEIRQAHQRLSSHMDNSPVGILEWDSNAVILSWSKGTERIFGWTEEEVVGKRWDELKFVHEDDIERAAQVADRLRSGQDSRNECENRNYTKWGGVLFCHWHNSSLKDENGKVVSILSIVQDITARTEAERALRASQAWSQQLIQNIPTAIVVHDSQTRITQVNTYAENLLGLSREEMIGKTAYDPVWQLYRNDGSAMDRSEFPVIRVLEERQAVEDYVIGAYRPGNDEMAWLLVNAVPVFDATGGISRVLVTFIDVTYRKQAEEELARYRDQLEQRVQERTRELAASQAQVRQSDRLASIGTLAAGIAHEVSNPIGGILVAAQSTQEDSNTPSHVKQTLAKIVREAERCGKIIRGILKFARQENSEKSSCDLNQVVREAVALSSQHKPPVQYRIEVSLADDVPQLQLNDTEIEQVVLNLLRNSSDAGAQVVKVITRRTDGYVELIVSDDGEGIAEEDQARLFDPFFTTRQNQGGSGLGLSIVHGILAEHNADINVESQHGLGTTITISFAIPTT